jgi:hypothetical protein
MSDAIPEAIQAIRDLTERMNEALQNGAIESFIDMADERNRVLRSFFGNETNTGLFNDTLSSVIAQDRLWIERLHELLRMKKAEIDQVRRKRAGRQNIARAYDRQRHPGRLFIQHG